MYKIAVLFECKPNPEVNQKVFVISEGMIRLNSVGT